MASRSSAPSSQQARLIAVVGPTGTGKTELSLEIAETIIARGGRAEIVNADAMQLYRGMDIGTAKLAAHERRGIPHHMFDVLDVTEESTVAAYQPVARAIIDEILAREATPILVGGSGLYVSAVLYEFEFPGTDAQLRARLEHEAETVGISALYQRLQALDPLGAAVIDQHNPRRVIRALEVIELTGKPLSAGLPEAPTPWREVTIVGLRDDRAQLTTRLDERVIGMWRAGLLDEVAALREHGLERGVTASRAIGYAQALSQLKGERTEREAIEETQALTRRYARRQMSWFKRYPGIRWFQAGQPGLAARALDTTDPGDGIDSDGGFISDERVEPSGSAEP